MTAFVYFMDEADGRKEGTVMRPRFIIVVAGYRMNTPIELAQIIAGAAGISEAEVAKMINSVPRPDALVPAADESLIHLLDAGERTMAIFDNVLVPEMSI